MKLRKKIMVTAACILLAGSLLLSGCDNKEKKNNDEAVTADNALEKYKDITVLTVGSQKLSYAEVLIYLRAKKQEVEGLYGTDIWGYRLDDEGKTYEQMLMETVLEELKYIKIVCAQAQELGISLSEDELLDVDEYTVSFMSEFTNDDLIYYGFDKETVRSIYKDNVLANKIYESLTLNVDTDVSDEEARRSEFYYILVAKYGFDEAGTKLEYSEEQLNDAKKRAKSIREKALAGEDFYALAKEYSDDDDGISMVVGKGEMTKELEDAAFGLKQGEVSDIIENDMGYFMFYCKSELEEEATNAAKEEIIKERQDNVFQESYNNWEENTEIKVNQELWDRITLIGGDVTLKELNQNQDEVQP